MSESIGVEISGPADRMTLVYLPGIHGDCTLIPAFRIAIAKEVCWVELTYPRTVTWRLEDYALQVSSALAARGISHGWLLAESFGSQVALGLARISQSPESHSKFRPDGVIFAGGFVRHPIIPGVKLLRFITEYGPRPLLASVLHVWKVFAQIRAGHDTVRQQSLNDFLARRTDEDRRAWVHRLRLIAGSDFRPVASSLRVPLCGLTGLWDPVVPWPAVRWWLHGNCPAYSAWRTIWTADHTVLFTQPDQSATAVLEWLRSYSGERFSSASI